MSARLTWAACLTLAVYAVFVEGRQQPTIPRPADPFADPKHDPYNPLRYIASNVLTAIAFSLIVLCALIQTYWMRRWGARWMSAMVIGEYCFAVGLACRFGLHEHPESKGIYIAEYLFVVLSPCAFIAADYVLLGRIARHLNANQYLAVPPRRITLIFVCSDVTTFLIQAAGGSLAISANHPELQKAGSHIVLVGLALQLASFAFFTCVHLLFLYRVHKHDPEVWIRDAGRKWYHDWRTLAAALSLSCVGILIRSTYRTIELSQGFDGKLSTTESYFYGLDTLPLAVAVFVYIPFWPGRFIPPLPKTVGNSEEKDLEAAKTSTGTVVPEGAIPEKTARTSGVEEPSLTPA
ncbi:RTA1-like protein [Punctularia strigosozonata HHB-11173 SS5]|uniref:RTA1-like protein n=1 Tax=Punctularia strigosozonata (strain HHB-11173) TaxID=741275 RepID=UPI0004416979|nr:RTA1-like protein [Punctularia strigosozonata HHB-11173 SS5]EIN10469.1 RTA1-like protein [Punctularia strigosozonata HHB-11173 SS5]